MKKKIMGVLLAIVVVIALIAVAGVAVGSKLNNATTVELDATEEELNVSPETVQQSKEKKIKNILLLGVDKD